MSSLNVFRFVHSADLHYSNNLDKLDETDRCTLYMLGVVEAEALAGNVPDVIILAGDTVDEFDGRIRLDSECARRVIAMVQRAAAIAPVVIIRGTKSHDRDAPYIFRHIQGKFPIYVASEIEQIALVYNNIGVQSLSFRPLLDALESQHETMVAAFSLIPSVDKSYLMTRFQGSIADGNLETRQLLFDLFSGMGAVNQSLSVPCIGVIHGMMTGSQFSSGQTAVGEDLEFDLSSIEALCCDYVAMGHVHMQQCFSLKNGRMACYSGSTGRLNMGEQEEKGFIVGEIEGRSLRPLRMFPTPARTFALVSIEWDETGADGIWAAARKLAETCSGADVRFRYTIPEEHRHEVDRGELVILFADAGAREVKVEPRILPKERQEADGISLLQDLPSKVIKWGEVSGTVISERVLGIARVIEGRSKEELILDAEALLNHAGVPVASVSGEVPFADTGDGQEIVSVGLAVPPEWSSGPVPGIPTLDDVREVMDGPEPVLPAVSQDDLAGLF